MTILKCKMCGGDIIVNENQTYGTCDSCGSTMTLPKIEDECSANNINCANRYSIARYTAPFDHMRGHFLRVDHHSMMLGLTF